MAKYHITFLSEDEGIAETKTLDSSNPVDKDCIEMVKSILHYPDFAQYDAFEREKFNTFKEDVESLLITNSEDGEPPEICECNMLDLFDEWERTIANHFAYWDLYWSIMRDVLRQNGLEELL